MAQTTIETTIGTDRGANLKAGVDRCRA